MSHLHLVLALSLLLAILVPGASQFQEQPAASPEPPAPVRAPQAPGDEHWAAGFNYPGANGVVLALAVGPNGSLYAGGEFTAIGSVAANYVARWDGAQWHPLDSGTDHSVFALAVGRDGSLYAGGRFTSVGDQVSSNIAQWNGDALRRYLPLIMHQ
jgi:hypothetical protein